MPKITQCIAAGLALCVALASSPAPGRAADATAPPQAAAVRSEPARAAAPQRMSHAAWFAGRAELRDIETHGRETVAAILARMRALPDGEERRALESEARQAKLDTRVRFLDAIARLARARGDEATAREAERQREFLTVPRTVRASAGAIQPIEKPAPAKGGRP